MRPTLSLHKRPDPSTRPKVDPAKVSLSENFGWRFIERDHRYILQKLVVTYETVFDVVKEGEYGTAVNSHEVELSRSWFDVPLVPETYVG